MYMTTALCFIPFFKSKIGFLGKVGEKAFRKLLIRLQICLWPKMLGLTDVLCSLFQQTKK